MRDYELSQYLKRMNVNYDFTENVKHENTDFATIYYYNSDKQLILTCVIDNKNCTHKDIKHTPITIQKETIMFKAIDHYTKQEKSYQFLTLDEIKALSGHALIVSNKGDIIRVKINGMVKTWKKDLNRFSVPVKYGLYECGRIEELNRFVKEV